MIVYIVISYTNGFEWSIIHVVRILRYGMQMGTSGIYNVYNIIGFVCRGLYVMTVIYKPPN